MSYDEILADPDILAIQRLLRRLDVRFKRNVSDNMLTITKLPVTTKEYDELNCLYIIEYELKIETIIGGDHRSIIQYLADREDCDLTFQKLKQVTLAFLDDLAISNIRDSLHKRKTNE